MENTFVSQRGLFWNKLGKWQVLAVILTLSVFSFISITGEFGDKISTTAIAAFIAFGLTVFTFSIYYGNATSAFVFAAFAVTAIAVVVFSTAFDCAAFVTAFATAFDLDFAFVIFALAVLALVVLALVLAADEAKRQCLKKRIFWLSFTAEFVVILLLLWLVH
jgi:hypothetical protein